MQIIIKPNDKPGGTPDLMTGLAKIGNNKPGVYLTNYDAIRLRGLLMSIKSDDFITQSEINEFCRILTIP